MLSHLHKRITSFVILALLFAAVIIPASRLFGEDSPGVAYLKSKPLSPWSIMALAAVGENPSLDSLKETSAEKAIELEAPILALTAAGKNPRIFGSSDLKFNLLGAIFIQDKIFWLNFTSRDREFFSFVPVCSLLDLREIFLNWESCSAGRKGLRKEPRK